MAVTKAGRAALPVRVEVSTTLPASSGLGSSAAIGVALIRALDPRASEADVLARAMVWERVFHGNPSGIDALMAARGGCFTFERGQPAIPINVQRRGFLCIGQSGAGASTKEMVSSVADQRVHSPEIAEATFAAIGAIWTSSPDLFAQVTTVTSAVSCAPTTCCSEGSASRRRPSM